MNEIEIMGYCEQNGHFNNERTELGYHCEHNTEGICCSQCKPGFRQKQWQPSTKEQPFQCERKQNRADQSNEISKNERISMIFHLSSMQL